MTVASDLPTMQPGDIYEDKHGTKWVVAGFWTDPVVQMEQVWPPTEGESRRQQAGIHGLLWDGFWKLAPHSGRRRAVMPVTPLHIQIAIHYHVSPEQWPMLHVPIHRKYAEDLTDAGLLRPRSGLATGGYEKTDGLAVWVDAICATPFPVKQWVMPKPPLEIRTVPDTPYVFGET